MKKVIIACFLFCIFSISAYSQSVAQETISAKVNGLINNQEQVISEPVYFNGEKIFSVSAKDTDAAKQRAKTISGRLNELLDSIKSNEIKIQANEETIIVRDGSLVLSGTNTQIISITEEDIHASGKTLKKTEQYYQKILNKKIKKAYQEYQDKQYRKAQIKKSWVYIISALLASLCLLVLNRKIIRSKWIFRLLLVGLWLFILAKVLHLFPETRLYNALINKTLLKYYSGFVLCLWVFTILSQVIRYLIIRYYRNKSTNKWSDTERQINRWNTQEHLLINLANVVTWIAAILTFILYTGIGSISLLTGAGVFGLAIGYIAQDIIKDYVNGLLIFLEDHFAVGDVIRVDGFQGEVTQFSLRRTTVRSVLSGTVTVIPNREIKVIENLTNTFSQIDFSMDVAYNTDLDFALQVMKETAEQLTHDYHSKIIDTPEVLGVEEFKDSSIRLRLIIKTLPRHQWELRRELNLRMKKAFDKNGITIPFPQRVVHRPKTD